MLIALSILNVNKSVVAVITLTSEEPPAPPCALKYANVAPTTKVISVKTVKIFLNKFVIEFLKKETDDYE